MLLKLAWRNIWRNKRRTAITLVMICFAVVLATFMATLRSGIMDLQVENAVGGHQGYATLCDTSYVEKPSIDVAFDFNESLVDQLNSDNDIKAYSPRIIGGGLMFSQNKFKAAGIIAVDPDLENNLTGFNDHIIKGRMIRERGEVVIGKGLSERLKVDVDSVVFVQGMGYHGNSANMKLRVVGVAKLKNVQQDKRVGFISMEEGFYSFATEGKVTEVALSFKQNSKAINTTLKKKGSFKNGVEIFSWKERNESLFMMVQMNDAANVIVSGMLYFIISFGLFGTILMMLSERKREFGMLVAIGMGRNALSFLVFLENTIMSFIGTSIGFLIAIPIIYYVNQNPIPLKGQDAENMEKFGFEPIIQTSMNMNIFFWQAFAVLAISLVFSLYPLFKIKFMNENKAMRS